MIRACSLQKNFTGFTASAIVCAWDATLKQLKITGGMSARDSISDPPTFTWYLNYMTNPRGIATSGMFNVTIYNKLN